MAEISWRDDELSLAELVNRVLDRGAVVTGEVVIGVAGVDLVFLGLQLVVTSAESARQREAGRIEPPADP